MSLQGCVPEHAINPTRFNDHIIGQTCCPRGFICNFHEPVYFQLSRPQTHPCRKLEFLSDYYVLWIGFALRPVEILYQVQRVNQEAARFHIVITHRRGDPEREYQ
ncbi:hypothetical protein PILCRDRAFT_297134 [Piloderma croceum F 1598]|uniref:Uncharacterized protein n=1 Tax=Piloderma croceum (strain F 1598) TaxID=765440 RepID=A0A0C3FSA6_PILCF|nr:hypothetical protein PILCRDRAFT_297134 [Piloderma croceum F 1598]